jgi:hypothetical protein
VLYSDIILVAGPGNVLTGPAEIILANLTVGKSMVHVISAVLLPDLNSLPAPGAGGQQLVCAASM